jgi:hypothetical protein
MAREAKFYRIYITAGGYIKMQESLPQSGFTSYETLTDWSDRKGITFKHEHADACAYPKQLMTSNDSRIGMYRTK